jgi:hypothetical protein
MTGARRLLAHALLAVHLVVFVLGGAFVARAPAQAPLSREAVTALGTSNDGTVVVSTNEGGLERTRPRGDRGERGAGSPHLDLLLPRSGVGVAPASLTGSLAIVAEAVDHRLLPSVVHGPRGPPQA